MTSIRERTANPTRVAIDELQLHDLKNMDAARFRAKPNELQSCHEALTRSRCAEESKASNAGCCYGGEPTRKGERHQETHSDERRGRVLVLYRAPAAKRSRHVKNT